MAAKFLKLDPYSCSIAAFRDRAKFNKAAAKLGLTIEEEQLINSDGLCTCFGPVILIGVFDASAATLAHELVHACSYALKHAGIRPMSNQQEPLAYLVGSTYQKLHKELL